MNRADLNERSVLAGFGCHGQRGARDYNGGLGAEPTAGVQGQSARKVVRGRRPLKLNAICILHVKEATNYPHY